MEGRAAYLLIKLLNNMKKKILIIKLGMSLNMTSLHKSIQNIIL